MRRWRPIPVHVSPAQDDARLSDPVTAVATLVRHQVVLRAVGEVDQWTVDHPVQPDRAVLLALGVSRAAQPTGSYRDHETGRRRWTYEAPIAT